MMTIAGFKAGCSCVRRNNSALIHIGTSTMLLYMDFDPCSADDLPIRQLSCTNGGAYPIPIWDKSSARGHQIRFGLLTFRPGGHSLKLMLQCSIGRQIMPAVSKVESSRSTHPRESSFVTLLSGWMQQGVNSFFATQRILLDLAMRQNASVMHLLRERLADPHYSPSSILTELAGEGVTNFIEAQKVLLNLAQEQNKIVMTGVKERVGGSAPATAMTDLLRRSVDTFIDMQQEFLKIAGKQTHTWMEAAKTGKAFDGERLIELAREGMENFVHAQKRFLDVIADETGKATGSKHANGTGKKMKKTEVAELARQATESFVEAQKSLFEVAGRQMNVNLKTASKTMELMRPLPLMPLAELTREGVKSFVDAQKELMGVMLRPRNGHKPISKPARHARRPARPVKGEAARAAAV